MLVRSNLAWILALLPISAMGAEADPSIMVDGAETIVYKEASGAALRLFVFKPIDWTSEDARPGIVFFFGGGWRQGNPNQFREHCKHFASRGMVAITVEYRVKSRHGVSPLECISDAKSAIRYVREHAKTLGIDSGRIVAAGGSAGGHLAACTGLVKGFDSHGEDMAISARANAMVLFNPALDTTALPSRYGFGDDSSAASPIHQIKEGAPPTIVFHGTDDKTVPFEQATRFRDAMQAADNRCELVAFEGKGHGFFNFGRDGNTAYDATRRAADAFLESLGYIEPLGKESDHD